MVSFITFYIYMSKKLLSLCLVLACTMALTACNKTEEPVTTDNGTVDGMMNNGATETTGDAMMENGQ